MSLVVKIYCNIYLTQSITHASCTEFQLAYSFLFVLEAIKFGSTPNVSKNSGVKNYEQSVTYVKGQSRSMNDVSRENSGYHPLCLQSNASLPEKSTSGTEASSFGSTYSTGNLLPDNSENTDKSAWNHIWKLSLKNLSENWYNT